MAIKTLTLHTFDSDDYPIEGTYVHFFDSKTSFGMFEQHYTRQGIVSYLSHEDSALFGSEILESEGYISVDPNNDESEKSVFVEVDGEYLSEGTVWIYDHEYTPVLDETFFPFQDYSYYEVAQREGWITVSSIDEISYNVDGKSNEVPSPWVWQTHIVHWGKKTFKLRWILDRTSSRFHDYEYLGQDERCV